VAALPGVGDPAALLERLGRDDLVVLDAGSREPLGAYPMTAEPTPHFLTVNGRQVNAMCAVDALAVGAMFDAEVTIDSRCHVTGAPIRIRQSGHRILAAEPGTDVRVGVRWQTPEGPAAHSLCLEMVFLRDGEVAAQWQGLDAENISLFTLDEAVDFGARFFLPLFED
jgi:hypothetical protein